MRYYSSYEQNNGMEARIIVKVPPHPSEDAHSTTRKSTRLGAERGAQMHAPERFGWLKLWRIMCINYVGDVRYGKM